MSFNREEIDKRLKGHSSAYGIARQLSGALNENKGDEEAEEYIRKLARKSLKTSVPFNRKGFLRVAEAFYELGMQKEAKEYARKAVGGIRILSGMSKKDRQTAYEILGEDSKANEAFHQIAGDMNSELDTLMRKGEYGQARKLANQLLQESDKKNSTSLRERAELLLKSIDRESEMDVSGADTTYKMALEGKGSSGETVYRVRDRIDAALQAGDVYRRNEEPYSGGRSDMAYATALSLADFGGKSDIKYVMGELKKRKFISGQLNRITRRKASVKGSIKFPKD